MARDNMKASAQTLLFIEQNPYLYYLQDDELEYFSLKKLVKKVGDFAGDIGKGIAYAAASGVNSVTGHTYSPEFKTGAGKFLSGLTVQGTDSIHVLGKTFGDTITGGNATKLANKIRKEENKESVGNYTESKIKTTGPLSQFEKLSKAGASMIGSVMASKANSPLKAPKAAAPSDDGYTTVYDVPYEEIPYSPIETEDEEKKKLIIAGVVVSIIIITLIAI
jgi:hypothetical protein